jgi:hypothetical protein
MKLSAKQIHELFAERDRLRDELTHVEWMLERAERPARNGRPRSPHANRRVVSETPRAGKDDGLMPGIGLRSAIKGVLSGHLNEWLSPAEIQALLEKTGYAPPAGTKTPFSVKLASELFRMRKGKVKMLRRQRGKYQLKAEQVTEGEP